MKRRGRLDRLRELARDLHGTIRRGNGRLEARLYTVDGTEIHVEVGDGPIAWVDVCGRKVALDACDVKRLAQLLSTAHTLLDVDGSVAFEPSRGPGRSGSHRRSPTSR